jgi:hypothetical protein
MQVLISLYDLLFAYKLRLKKNNGKRYFRDLRPNFAAYEGLKK